MIALIFKIVLALILIFAMPHIISATVKRKGNRKGLTIICKIFGWLLLFLAIWSLVQDFIYSYE